jgi:dUTPase
MFKVINEYAKLPQAEDKYSAGYDIVSPIDIEIIPGYSRTIRLGIVLDLDETDLEYLRDYYIALHITDSMAREGLLLANGVGIININSKEEIRMIVLKPLNDSQGYENKSVFIKKGDKIGQLLINKNEGKILLGSKYRK